MMMNDSELDNRRPKLLRNQPVVYDTQDTPPLIREYDVPVADKKDIGEDIGNFYNMIVNATKDFFGATNKGDANPSSSLNNSQTTTQRPSLNSTTTPTPTNIQVNDTTNGTNTDEQDPHRSFLLGLSQGTFLLIALTVLVLSALTACLIYYILKQKSSRQPDNGAVLTIDTASPMTSRASSMEPSPSVRSALTDASKTSQNSNVTSNTTMRPKVNSAYQQRPTAGLSEVRQSERRAAAASSPKSKTKSRTSPIRPMKTTGSKGFITPPSTSEKELVPGTPTSSVAKSTKTKS